MVPQKGHFISFEGPDGAGKSSAIQALVTDYPHLPLYVTREPGGSPLAEQIRTLVLDTTTQKLDDWTEALLYAAARRQHLIETILPHLANGDTVFCDRFTDSSLAYQGGGRLLGVDALRQLNEYAVQGIWPDLTLYFDLPVQDGLNRIRKNQQTFDRLEQESLAFHNRVRSTYLQLAQDDPQRIVLIDATQSPQQVVAACQSVLAERFSEFRL